MPALRDLDKDLLAAAVAAGLISAADRERVEAAAEAARGAGKPAWAGQLLVRERLISCEELLALQDRVAARVYECPHCQHRHTRAELDGAGGKQASRGGAIPCHKCGRRLRTGGALTRLEVLAAGDPLELTIPLPAASGSELDPSLVSGGQEVTTLDLDRYDVQDELGRGAYGVVFRAHHKDLQRDVALKVLKSGDGLPRVALERFLQEGRALSRLEHPHVIKVFDIGQHRDLFVMAMELVDGVPLKRWVKRFPDGKVPWRDALTLFHKLLGGLAAAHAAGLVHRDLKPSNVLVDARDDPKLIDFGLAKDLTSDQSLTVAHAIVGTPAYLSPEQIEGRSREADPRSDVFALGAILYELLAGRRPWSARNKTEIYAQILREEPPPLEELVSDLPTGLSAHVHRALQKQPRARFADAAQMRAALATVLEASPPPATPEASEPVRRAPGTATGKRKRTGPVRTAARPAPAPRAAGGPPLVPLLIGGAVVVVLGLGLALGRGPAPDDAVAAAMPAPPPAPAPAPAPASARPPAPAAVADDPRPAAPAAPEEDPPPPPPEPTPEEPTPEEPTPEEPAPDEPAPHEPAPAPAEPPPPAPRDPLPAQQEAAPEPAPAPPEPAPPTPPPEPAARPPLDRGEQDAREHPDLADRKPEEWLKRAFLINQLADDPNPRPYTVHGLRLALSDPYERNPAFALRGLLLCPDPLLRAAGSQGLFEALVDLLDSKEAYLARKSRVLLRRLSDGQDRKDAAAWKAWWEEAGHALFAQAAQEGPRGAASPGGPDKAGAALVTRVRNSAKLVSQVRKKGLDTVFLLDVTKSMGDELAKVKQQVAEIMAVLDLLLGEKKSRMGFVTYGDSVVETVKLTDDLPKLVAAVEQLQIFDDPKDLTVREAVELALGHALSAENALGWRKSAHRVMLLLADAPALNQEECKKLAARAHQGGWTLHTLVSQPPSYASKHPPWDELAELARLGGGQTARLDDPEQLMTQLLVLSFGPDQEPDLRAFVRAYREVTRDNE